MKIISFSGRDHINICTAIPTVLKIIRKLQIFNRRICWKLYLGWQINLRIIKKFYCIVCYRNCGISNPSWAELRNYTVFLNEQLLTAENNHFCQSFLADDLPGFFPLVVACMIRMSRDFSTRSLEISEETPELISGNDGILEKMTIKHRWETQPHPYLFFNNDGHTFSFFGFNVDRKTGDLIDYTTKVIVHKGAFDKHLLSTLLVNKVNLSENFDELTR